MPIKKKLSDLVADHSNGDFDEKCSLELRKVIEAVEAGHGTGKIVITLSFKKENRMVVSKPSVKATVPMGAVSAAMFFVTEDGDLSDEDPKQATFNAPGMTGKLVPFDGGSDKNDSKKKDN
jgi:hypothetical protein